MCNLNNLNDIPLKLLVLQLFFMQDGSLDKLNMSEFLILANSIENFQKQSEAISGKQSTALRLALQNQV